MQPDDVPSPIDFRDPAQARRWELETIRTKPWRPRFFAAFVASLHAHFHAPFSVLELGSGPGHLAEQILRGCSVSRYVALDFSPAMHALAQLRLADFPGRVEFMEMDFRDAHWTAHIGPFQAVVTMQAAHELRHVRYLPAFLDQVRACLVDGGMLLYCDHHSDGARPKQPALYLPREGQAAALRAAGFAGVREVLDIDGMALYAAVKGADGGRRPVAERAAPFPPVAGSDELRLQPCSVANYQLPWMVMPAWPLPFCTTLAEPPLPNWKMP
jgi:SAM-dependent methyltransferase